MSFFSNMTFFTILRAFALRSTAKKIEFKNSNITPYVSMVDTDQEKEALSILSAKSTTLGKKIETGTYVNYRRVHA